MPRAPQLHLATLVDKVSSALLVSAQSRYELLFGNIVEGQITVYSSHSDDLAAALRGTDDLGEVFCKFGLFNGAHVQGVFVHDVLYKWSQSLPLVLWS